MVDLDALSRGKQRAAAVHHADVTQIQRKARAAEVEPPVGKQRRGHFTKGGGACHAVHYRVAADIARGAAQQLRVVDIVEQQAHRAVPRLDVYAFVAPFQCGDGAVEHLIEPLALHRLEQIVERLRIVALNGEIGRGRERDDDAACIALAQFFPQLDAVLLRHHHVEQVQVERLAHGKEQRFPVREGLDARRKPAQGDKFLHHRARGGKLERLVVANGDP